MIDKLTPEPGSLLRTGARDRDLGWHITASWADVQRKAKRIRAEGGVTIVVASTDGIGGHVVGDHGTYEALLVYRPGTRKIADWTCGCKWSAFAFDRSPAFKQFEGRKCSHALALQFEAQSQGMFGKEVHPAETPPGRSIVKYDPDADEHVFARPYQGSLIGSLVARLRAEDADPAETIGSLVTVGLKHAAAVTLWKAAEHGEIEHEHHCPHCGAFLGVAAFEHHHCPHCGAPLGGEGHHHHEGSVTASHQVWFHGTPAEHVDAIREHGVQKSNSDWDLRLTDSKDQAAVYARRGGHDGKVLEYHVPEGHPAIGPRYEHNMYGQNAHAVSLNEPLPSTYLVHEHTAAKTEEPPGPKCSGVMLKAHDTGRVLMLQRGQEDGDPASGRWEFPGGHHEDGDKTSLHAGLREWEEEIGQEFPLHGAVKHTWTSPDGIYQGHVVVIPSEKDLSMKDGRVVPNPDDPHGDNHEQAAWWEVAHAKGNKALRDEVRAHTPWKEIEKASLDAPKQAAAWDPISNTNPQPGRGTTQPAHSNTTNPASTGWAASDDPDNWNNLDADPEPLTPSLGFDAVLHEPEPALPVTYGDEDATMRPAEMTPADLDPVPDNPPQPAHLVPDQDANIHLLDGGSTTPNSYHASVAEIVADFQRTAAGQALVAPPAGDDDIAAAAQAHLEKTGAAQFTFAEQQELIGEAPEARARNFAALKIEGTHYELLAAALANQEADGSDLFI